MRRQEKGLPPSAGPDRDVLRRRVRIAAAGATDLSAFFTRLGGDGVLVKERRSQRDPDQITGYAVALATGREPVWFGGGKLAPDLSLPRLQDRWASSSPRRNPRPAPSDGERTAPPSATARAQLRRTLPSETRQVLALLAQLQSLAATVASLREAQGRAAQAAAARAAAEHLPGAVGRQAQPPPAATLVDLLSVPARVAATGPRHRSSGRSR